MNTGNLNCIEVSFFEKQELDGKLKKLLQKAPPNYSRDKEPFFAEFFTVINRADELNHHSEIADKARKKLDFYIENRMDPDTQRLLEGAISSVDEAQLVKAMEKADEFHYNTKLVKRCRELKEKVVQINADLRDAISGVDQDGLRKSIDDADAVNLRSSDRQTAQSLLDNIVRIESDGDNATNAVDRFQLTAVIDEAASIGLNSEKIQKCTEFRDRIDEIDRHLDNARERVVEEEMASALAEADEIRLNSTQTQQCRDLYNQVCQIHEAESYATQARDRDQMSQCIDDAYAIGLNSPQIQHCVILRDRIDRIYEEEANGAITLSEEHMQVTLAAADAINLPTEQCEEFRRLLSLGKSEFIKAQMRQATIMNDKSRLIWLAIEMKNWYFSKSQDMFQFRKFDKLKLPSYWASEKILSMKKQELSANMLKHQKQKIHAALTEMPKTELKSTRKLGKEAVKIFTSIQGYMGDIEAKEDDQQLATEILHGCCSEKSLRDEALCQIIKQITNNSDQQSVKKGWDLMKLCLATFPPDDDFENYLECWIREQAPQKEVFLVRLHRTIYANNQGGMMCNPPPPHEMGKILGDVSTEGFSEPKQDPCPFEDLKYPYDQDFVPIGPDGAPAGGGGAPAGGRPSGGPPGGIPGGFGAPAGGPPGGFGAPAAAATGGYGAPAAADTGYGAPAAAAAATGGYDDQGAGGYDDQGAAGGYDDQGAGGYGDQGAEEQYYEDGYQPEQRGDWLQHLDPDSNDYYYENITTGETTWDPPQDFLWYKNDLR